MVSIEERAKYNATFIGNQSPFDAYIEGAKDQQKIDAELAAEWIKNNGADFCLGEDSFDGSFAADMLQKFILNQ